MTPSDSSLHTPPKASHVFLDDLTAFASEHRAHHWSGTFAEFLEQILPEQPARLARSSHQYLYDMLCWYRDRNHVHGETAQNAAATDLFKGELFGIDPALERVVDYFKAAAAGSDVGRRLLLLLGPPSGGKSSLVILLKRGLEEYSHTDEGALYSLSGSPLHESPLNLIPASMRGRFRETYGVNVTGELSPHSAARLDDEFDGDFMRFPVASDIHLGSLARRRRHLRAARSDHGRYRRSRRLRGSIEGGRDRRRRRPARLVLVGGGVRSEPRRSRDDRNSQGQARVPLFASDADAGEEREGLAFSADLSGRDDLAHTNLAEFNRFLQEKENEALLDRMVIVKVPYTLSYHDEARIYRKLVSSASAFQSRASGSARARSGRRIRDPHAARAIPARGARSTRRS